MSELKRHADPKPVLHCTEPTVVYDTPRPERVKRIMSRTARGQMERRHARAE